MALAEDNPLINPDPLIAALREQDVSESQIMESLEVLDNRGYIQLHRAMGPPHVDAFSVQSFGFDDLHVRSSDPEVRPPLYKRREAAGSGRDDEPSWNRPGTPTEAIPDRAHLPFLGCGG